MKVLITGITGFVGSNLSRFLLSKGIEVFGLSRNPLTNIDSVSNCFSYSLLSELNPNDFDAVIHLAGKAHDLKKGSTRENYLETNYKLTRRIFDWYSESKSGKFLFLSSVKAAADQSVTDLKEDFEPKPATDYGISKLEAEKYIISKNRELTYILRPCMIHGPGNKGNLNLLYQVVKKGLPWPLASYHNSRSFLSVENLSFIIWKMLIKTVPPGIYHLADNEKLSTNQLIDIIAKSLGKKAIFIKVPKNIVNFIAKAGDILKLPLNTERLSKLTESYTVSNNKVLKAINDDLPVTADKGINQTIKSFQKLK